MKKEILSYGDLRFLTPRELEYYKKLTPVWIEDIRRVKCPEELPEVVALRRKQKAQYQNKHTR